MQNQPKKILVVDDDPDIVEFIQTLLEDEGYAVITASRSEYFDDLCAISVPDLILLDMLLSGQDGRDIARKLKSQAKTKRIPLIMFSAHPHAEKMVMEAGADDFIKKPFDIDLFLEKVALYL
jgi:DNA-binding response OmpR family regulator